MAKAAKRGKSGDNIPQTNKKPTRAKRKRMSTKERVKIHYENEHDVITEDDIKHAELDLGIPDDPAKAPLPIENNPDRPHDEGKDKPKVTPWDVIGD